MEWVEFTLDMLEIARDKAKEMGNLNNSITNGEGNEAGFLGEEIVLALIQRFERSNTYDYDLICEKIKIEIKSKRCTSTPKMYYECSVADFNTKQDATIYIFTRILTKNGSTSGGWFLGWLPKEEFYTNAIFHKKGDVDSSNNFTFKADCYNISISELRPLNELEDYIDITNILND